jgi:hypothetical protein
MKKMIFVFVIIFAASVAFAQNLPPTIFYSDLVSGPNTGGQNNAGAFVTIHGKGFGSARGSSGVTVGGASAASYESWSDSSVTFQLGSAAQTGSIVANVGGIASNSIPFTVRSGNIYFVSKSGSDSQSGAYSAPWLTVTHAVNIMQAGDIIYLENGYVRSPAATSSSMLTSVSVSATGAQNTASANNSALVLSRGGTASSPMAIVAYPNSVVTIGSSTGLATGIDITASNWVLSGLVIRGALAAVSTANVSGIRLANSDISCPNGYGSGACIGTNGGSSFAFLGNKIHDSGSTTNANLESYQTMYLLGTNGVEIGWNTISNTRGCNAIGAHANTGSQYSYSVHDNYIQGTRCEAIALGTVDPSQGAVVVYNNIIANSGTGPVPGGTAAGYGYAAIVVGGGSGVPVNVYNNTIYNSGALGGASAGAIRAFGATNLTNNIFYLLSGQQYVSLDTNLSFVTGSNNLFFGAGNPLGVFSESVVGDPMFANLANSDFHLLKGSPAIDSGATVQLGTDYDGVMRPQGSAYDIGAYEFPEQAGAEGTLAASPTSLSFETVTVGQSATTTTTLSNTSNTSVTISQINSNSSAFQTSGISVPMTLNAGQSATLTVTFVPAAAGVQSGTITVTSNGSNSPTNISVTGTGQAATPSVSLSPTSLTFASQAVSTTSAAQSITLTNTGTGPLAISGIAASGDFAQTNTCSSSLAASASCAISVTFTPTATGTRTGAIAFTDNAASSPQQVSLSGTATAAPSATLKASASSLSFGSITAGTTSTKSLVITNSGTASTTISQIATGNAVFSVTGATLPATVAAGGTLTLTVKFAPSSGASYSSSLTIQSNATNPTLSVALTGSGTAPSISLSPTSLTFASQAVSTTSAAQSITLTNTGTASLAISGIAASGDFAQTNTCSSSLAANASCAISVTFTPTATGTRTGAIAFTDNAASSPQQVSLSGTATAAPSATLKASASSLSFGSITAGTTSTKSLVITNSGTASATISQIATGNAVFSVTGATLPATVAAGGSLTLTVTFTPATSAAYTGTLAVQSNATNPTLSVALSGTGLAVAVQHSVTLTWAEASTGVSGYNVYRSTQSGTGYTKLNSSLDTSLSYVDTTVSAGQTYYYVVTSVDGSGDESAYSSQVSAVVPTP